MVAFPLFALCSAEAAPCSTAIARGVDFDFGRAAGAWLIDDAAQPAPLNEVFLQRLDNPMVVPELALFNIELNDHPQHLWGTALGRMEASLGETWRQCMQVAEAMQTHVMMIGILPTV